MAIVGVFGGTFDPPHLGHVAAVRAARDALGLDEVLVVVAKDPQHREPPLASPDERLELARAAFGALEGVVVSDLELRREGPTYTIDTVEALRAAGATDVVLILGADAAAGLAGWHRAEDLEGLVTIAVVPRPGGPHEVPPGFRAIEVPMAPVDLSSTEVRAALAAGADPGGLIPPEIVHLVLTNRRYHP